MINLIKFEICKILKSKIFYINLIILITLSFLIVLINYKSNNYNNEYNYVSKEERNGKFLNEIKNNNKIVEYIEINNITNNDKIKNTFDAFITFLMFSNFLISYYSSKILSQEFENGTIKNLLVKPYSRSKIFLSKLLIVIFISILYSLVIYFSSLLFTTFMYEINIFKLTSFTYTNEIKEISFILKYTKYFYITFIQVLFLSVLSYNLSLIFMNSFFSYLLSICLSIFGPVISIILFNINFKLVKYTFLPYLDFKFLLSKLDLMYFNEIHKVNLNILNGIIIFIIYSTLLTYLAITIFKKMDIKK